MKSVLIAAATTVAFATIGCVAKPEISDRFETLTQVTAYRDLSAWDRALYYGGERRDRAAIAGMLSSGEMFDLPAGTTGAIIGFPRPAMMDTASGNMNDWSRILADVRLDNPSREAVINLDKTVKIIRPEKAKQ